jgi:hypothetical protein
VAYAGAPTETVVEAERIVARKLRDGADAEHVKVTERGGTDVGEVGEAEGADAGSGAGRRRNGTLRRGS